MMVDLRNIRRSDISALATKFNLDLDLTLPAKSLRLELTSLIERKKLRKAAKDRLLALVAERER